MTLSNIIGVTKLRYVHEFKHKYQHNKEKNIHIKKMAGKGKGKSKKPGPTQQGKKQPVSRSARAGLQFPVGRIHRYLKDRVSLRIGGTAAVYMAAVLEYLCAEVLELAGNASEDMKVKRITPRHILLAVRGDGELDTVFTANIAQGGVVPYIHKSLLPKSRAKKALQKMLDNLKEKRPSGNVKNCRAMGGNMTIPDCYDPEQLRKQRILSHPDKNRGCDKFATEQFKFVNAAGEYASSFTPSC